MGGCAPLLAEPNVLLSAGTTSTSGWLNSILSFPHEAQFVGATLHTQSLAWDPTFQLYRGDALVIGLSW